MLSLRARIFIVISLILLVILGISLLLLFRAKQKAQAPEANLPGVNAPATNNGGIATQPSIPGSAVTPAVKRVSSDLEVEQNAVKQLARIFTERFQTYSTDNQSSNVVEVKSLVTDSLWKRISSRLTVPAANAFSGATTEVFSTKLTSWNPPQAVVDIQTIRTLEQNNKTNVKHQGITINLVKQNNNWLVDSYQWGK